MPLPKKEFARRRRELMLQMAPNSIAVVAAGRPKIRSRDTEYHFRQNSDFFYLSGFEEPEAVLVLVPERVPGEYIVFCLPKDEQKELWEGRRAGEDGLLTEYGADQAYAIDEIDEVLPGLCEGREKIYYNLGQDECFDSQVLRWVNAMKTKVRTGINPPKELADLSVLLDEMRLVKSDAELKILGIAGELGARAHIRAMNKCTPGMYEFQLEAEIMHEFAHAGARFAAYNSIVGGGKNACILHYTNNEDPLHDGDLVLIDAGCEYQYYATDITRTFPVSGRFTAAQKTLYDLVLKAQEHAIDQVFSGNTWNSPHEASVRVITEGLVELGILAGDISQLIEEEAYKLYYMHKVGHWLGMDVHDVGSYKVDGHWRTLKPGMVMTIEPGIYIAANDTHVDPKWRGIGIRIEDVVVVTDDGCRILTGDVPKATDDIEALMAL